MANAICSILTSVLPGRAGKAWYSVNIVESMQSLNMVLSIPSSMQWSSSKFLLLLDYVVVNNDSLFWLFVELIIEYSFLCTAAISYFYELDPLKIE